MAGFYGRFLVMGFLQGHHFAVIGVGGVILILLSYLFFRARSHSSSLMYICGELIMVFSLLIFFQGNRWIYIYETFTKPIPLFTLIVFAFIAVRFLIYHLNVLKFRRQ